MSPTDNKVTPRQSTPAAVKLFVALTCAAGIAAIVTSFAWTGQVSGIRLATFTVLAAVASVCKLKLPGHDGTMSVNLPYILLAVAILPGPVALFVAAVAVTVQSVWSGRKRLRLLQLAFNIAMVCCAVRLSQIIFAARPHDATITSSALFLLLAGVVYFVVNTAATAIVVGLAEHRSPARVWRYIFDLTLPYYALGTSMALVGIAMAQYAGWQVPLAAFPLLYGVYRSYRVYFQQAADEGAGFRMSHAATA